MRHLCCRLPLIYHFHCTHHFTGECCFSLFSEADGGGYEQMLEYDTEAILDIEDVKSVFIVECYK